MLSRTILENTQAAIAKALKQYKPDLRKSIGFVDEKRIGTGAVTVNKIPDATITTAKLAFDVATQTELDAEVTARVALAGAPFITTASSADLSAETLLSSVIDRGLLSARPSASIAGRLYYATDTSTLYRDNGSTWDTVEAAAITPSWANVFSNLTDPTLQTFAWVNQGSATVDNNIAKSIFLYAPAVSGTSYRIQKKSLPSAPYTITACVIPQIVGLAGMSCGILLRESSSGKFVAHQVTFNSDLHFRVTKFTSPTVGSTDYQDFIMYQYNPIWLRWQDDNTNRMAFYSVDGNHFQKIATNPRTDFITPDECGFFVNSGQASFDAGMLLLSWLETTP